jgi:hypothetical protein
MQGHAVPCAVLAALGENLDAVVAFAEVDVDLAILSVHFLLTADPALDHGQAMLDAPPLEPWLAANLDS